MGKIREDVNKAWESMKKQNLLTEAVKDLVRLSILSNNVIAKGSFPGIMADEVNEVMKLCADIHKEFVKEYSDGK